jgi:hypothetical protein
MNFAVMSRPPLSNKEALLHCLLTSLKMVAGKSSQNNPVYTHDVCVYQLVKALTPVGDKNEQSFLLRAQRKFAMADGLRRCRLYNGKQGCMLECPLQLFVLARLTNLKSMLMRDVGM